jgi:phosphatidylserine/phosphatidylglycerophosphate/cardiolipin synthase-like enzyme
MDIALPASDVRAGADTRPRAHAARAATVIDNAAYFVAARDAMLRARRSILLLGWGFDPRTSLVQEGAEDGWPTRLGPFLAALAERRPEVEIRLLIWDMALFMSAANAFYPQRAAGWFRDGRVRFRLDRSVPAGACHHQKLLIVDGALAFCGGGDLMADRWDTAAHTDGNARRRLPSGSCYCPRHEVMLLLEGPAAVALDAVARERWLRATGEALVAAPADGASCWPASVGAEAADIPVSIARTDPYAPAGPILEIERAYRDAIASARRLIYLENQYFTATAAGDALAARLSEPDGPAVVVITSRASTGFADALTMDSARDALIARLREADRHRRFHVYAPLTPGGKPVNVHSKVMVVDDRILCVGSANLNNRSFGYDTECNVALEAPPGPAGAAARRMIGAARDRLLAHFLGGSPRALGDTIASDADLAALLAGLDDGAHRRLAPLHRVAPSRLGAAIARYCIGDPFGPADAWRPWRRSGSRAALRDPQRRDHRQMV